MIGRAGHLHGFDTHILEVAQTINPVARDADFFTVVPGCLKLAELAADHLVAGTFVAGDIDAAHKGAAARVGLNRDLHAVGRAIHRGLDLGGREGETEVGEIVGERLGGLRHVIRVVRLAGLDLDQGLEFVLLFQVVAFHADFGDDKALALRHIDGDQYFLLVRCNRDLGRIHLELQIAFGQIKGPQGFDVRIEFAAHVAVGLGVPTQPGSSIQIELIKQRAASKSLIAHNGYGFDLGRSAFGH